MSGKAGTDNRIYLVEGGENCGKSRYAESLFSSLSTSGIYIATMIPYGKYGEEKIISHRKQRAGLNLITKEYPYIDDCDIITVPQGSTVILEDISNLTANRYFDRGEGLNEILNCVINLSHRCHNLIIVGLRDLNKDGCDEKTVKYIELMDSVMDKLEEAADCVILMKDNTAITLKPLNQYSDTVL